jgi:hypothetical protein
MWQPSQNVVIVVIGREKQGSKLVVGSRYFAALLTLLFSAPLNEVFAQASTSVCAALASRLTPDISTQTSSDTRSAFYRKVIQDDRFSSLSTASNTQLDVGLSVLSYVDFTLGTKSDERSWSTNWRKFRSSDNEAASLSKQLSISSTSWNPQLIENLLSNCPNQGFYAQITSVDPDYSGFTIAVHGNGSWQLLGIQPTRSDSSFSCSGAEKASEKQPLSKTNTIALACQKDPNKTITLTITSSQDSAGPLTIYSKADALTRNLAESTNQIGTLRRDVAALENKLDGLNQKMVDYVNALNDQFRRAQEYHPDGEKTVDVNTGGGAGTPAVDCQGGKFLSHIQFSADTSGNMTIHVTCASVPVFAIKP